MEELVSSVLGWEKIDSPDGVSASFAHAQPDGGRLVLEVGRKGGPWLWVLAHPEARAFGLPEAQVSKELLEALAGMQDTLTLSNYLKSYLDLQKHCEITIMAWEQFSGVAPPFGDVPSGGGGGGGGWGKPSQNTGGGGWGNDSGNKGW